MARGNILIDTSTDLRQQALLHGIRRVDAVLFTHSHADHVHGIDELRSFNHIQSGRIPCYANQETISNIRKICYYIFDENTQVGGGIPLLDMFPVEKSFELFGLRIQPVPILHGRLEILGYRIGDIAYITDCSEFPASSLQYMKNLDLLFVNALRLEPHSTHFSLSQALDLIESIRPKMGILTHLGHQIDYHQDYQLPENVELAYDGMAIDSVQE
jgi:phosphoribosyl 1,2-cyclic phosphate phosphodiesterase